MSEKKYRVIQWATGTVGKVALKHFIENPTIELVGVFVTNPQKVAREFPAAVSYAKAQSQASTSNGPRGSMGLHS
jgi:hypothetical protein